MGGRQAELDAAIAQYNSVVLDAVKEAGDALASVQSLTRQQSLQTEAAASAEKPTALPRSATAPGWAATWWC